MRPRRAETHLESQKTNLGSYRLLSSRDVVELLDAVEELAVELGSLEAANINSIVSSVFQI